MNNAEKPKLHLQSVTNRYLIEYNNEFGRNRQTYIDAENSTQARAIFYNTNHHATIVYTQKV